MPPIEIGEVLYAKFHRGYYPDTIARKYCCLCLKQIGKAQTEGSYNSVVGYYAVGTPQTNYEPLKVAHRLCMKNYERGSYDL